MEFGIALSTTTESWRLAKRAEALGFATAWFYDTQLLNPDVFIAMTQAAMNTERIRLGTGVLIPSNRIEPVTANALATLNKLAPGRIDFGVGSGFTGRRTMGLSAIPLARLERYVLRVQALLRGETVSWDFEGHPRRIRFLNPELGLIHLEDEIPLYLSAMGPRARRLCARLGAGWLNFAGDVPSATAALDDLKEARTEHPRADALPATLMGLGCVLEPGERADSERAIAQAGPWVQVQWHNLVETTEAGALEGVLPAAANEALERYRKIWSGYEPADARYLDNHRGHLLFVREDERPLLSAELISAMSFTATVAELRERLRALEAAGYTQFAIQIVEGHEDALERWAEVFEGV